MKFISAFSKFSFTIFMNILLPKHEHVTVNIIIWLSIHYHLLHGIIYCKLYYSVPIYRIVQGWRPRKITIMSTQSYEWTFFVEIVFSNILHISIINVFAYKFSSGKCIHEISLLLKCIWAHLVILMFTKWNHLNLKKVFYLIFYSR